MSEQIAPGVVSSEYKLSKGVVILGAVISALGTVLTVLGPVTATIPPSAGSIGLWLAIGGAAVAGVKAALYEVQRTLLKVEAIKSATKPPSA